MNEQDFRQFLAVKKGLASLSVKMYTMRFSVLLRYLKEEHKELDKKTVEEFIYGLREKGLKNSAINTYILMLGHLRDYLSDRGLESEFLQGFKSLPKVESSIEALTNDEVTRLLSVQLEYKRFRGQDTSFLDEMYNTFWRFLADTGARFDEASLLKVKYVNIASGHVTLTETKNRTTRRVYPSSFTLKRLEKRILNKKPDDLVFTNFLGSRVIPQTAQEDLKNRARAAGITGKRVYPHLLRHSFATELIRSGVGVESVQLLLGHKDITTTTHYIHLADETLRKQAFRHPRLRSEIEPTEVLGEIIKTIEGFRLDLDERFDCIIEKGKTYITVKISVDK